MGKFFKKKTKKGGLEGDAAGGVDSVEGVNDDKENTAGHKADGEVTEDSTTKDAALADAVDLKQKLPSDLYDGPVDMDEVEDIMDEAGAIEENGESPKKSLIGKIAAAAGDCCGVGRAALPEPPTSPVEE